MTGRDAEVEAAHGAEGDGGARVLVEEVGAGAVVAGDFGEPCARRGFEGAAVVFELCQRHRFLHEHMFGIYQRTR